ncbi:HAD-IA family hydrolase [Streptomyces sp. TRM43335]|uniref:HAD-IA family hydrolase n=1 Tax=Streptomyces taklimakanensis TaxID=2569853 RepID=A0A6G2B9V1_9ACTN|nr:HAD-IA family hydrolase [Streptomyces taklimakanensis]MTE18843.1 HAD-IA family hydrolase [Streptomyces taklimakanensis]
MPSEPSTPSVPSDGAPRAAAPLTARALLLDMDGTLVDSDAAVERVWRGWAAEHGLDGDEVMRVAHGRQGYATMAELLPDRPMEVNHEENRRLLALETADTDDVVPIPGAPAFLAAIEHLPHALVTSATLPLATARMTAAGLPMPRVRVTAEAVGAGKPHPEGFLKAAAELGFAPEDCVVFEDSAAGVAAGRAAGMRVVGVGPRAGALSPTLHVPSLERLRVEPLDGEGVRLSVLPEGAPGRDSA